MLCKSYCSHGGRCMKEPGHDGLHDSDYCTWTDAEAVTREQADSLLREQPGGEEFLEFFQPLSDLLEGFDQE